MEYLDQEYFGNSVRAWLLAFGVAVATIVAVRLLKGLFVRSIAKLTPATFDGIQDLLGDVLGRTKFFLVFVIAVYAGASTLILPGAFERAVAVAAVIAALLQIGLWGNAIITFWIGKIVQRKIQHDAAGATTMTALGFLGRVVLWTGLLLFALDNLGVNITGLAAGIGIGGIAIALAVQSILGDLFASLSIVLDKPFVIGDFIIVDEYLGTVEHIGLKTTRVRSLSGEQLVFSNADLLNSRIRNYKRMFERRVVFEVGITYQTPLEKVEALSGMIQAIIEDQPKVRFDRAHFKNFGDSSLVFESVYYVKSAEYNDFMDTQERINLAIMKQFVEQGIDFAYPTRTLFVQGEGKNTLQQPNETK
ncbi:MAG: mechanosensitive ion channel family protein [Bacteroidota bacterium]